MTEKWELAEVEIAEFRGVKGSLLVKFEPGLNIIGGDNGAGKTTICQAMEWCLFGKLPALAGGEEFQSEDAIHNRLVESSGASRVQLTLRRNAESVSITRVRRRGVSSTRGTSSLTLEMNGASLGGREAEAKVSELLGVDASEFGSSALLRQDTIGELVLGDEDIRSAAIDELLGLGQIRELLENLQLSAIDRAVRQVGEEVKSQEENVIGAASMRRVQLANRRQAFINKGVDEATLTVAGAWRFLAAQRQELRSLGEKAGVDVPAVETAHGTVAELQKGLDTLTGVVRSIGAGFNDRELGVRQRTDRMHDLLERFRMGTQKIGDLGVINLDDQRRELDLLGTQLEEANAEVRKLSDLRNAVDSARQDMEALVEPLAVAHEGVAQLEAEQLPVRKSEADGNLASVVAALNRQSTLDRLLVVAREHLAAHKPDRCPLCQQPIEPTSVLSQIDGFISERAQLSAQLNARLKELQELSRDVDGRLATLDQYKRAVARDEARWNELLAGVARDAPELRNASLSDVRELAASIARKYSDVVMHSSELEEQCARIKARIAGIEDAQAEVAGIVDAVKTAMGIDVVPPDIPSAITAVLQDLQAQLSELAVMRRQLSGASPDLTTAQEVITYLREVEDVGELEQQVPPVRRRMRQLSAARQRLAELRQTVQEVYNALTALQEETLGGNLTELVPAVQDLFLRLGAHPEFSRLAIEPVIDSKKGTTRYRLRAESEQLDSSTFVRTTFSRAELNTVAVALFLAVSRASDHSFGVTILDDPSQSLDPQRQRALADVLDNFARERQTVVTTEDPTLLSDLTSGGRGRLIRVAHEPFQGTVIVQHL
jgi:DNA repair exonuclease SbcCD ATPase subunit